MNSQEVMYTRNNTVPTYTTPPIARRVHGVQNQAGLLAQASSFSKPSQFPSGIYGGLRFYSGGTAWDFNPLPFSLIHAFIKKRYQHLTYI